MGKNERKSEKRQSTEWKRVEKLVKRYRVTDGRRFRLKDIDPDDTGGLGEETKPVARDLLAEGVRRLTELQDRLYAEDRRALLIVFQAMDAAGKDSTIKHVMSGVNPMGCHVSAFKQPSDEELDHDYLWRCLVRLPERGRIGIFNRSYYEEVLVVRVHPEILAGQKLPPDRLHDDIFEERLQDMAAFEQYLHRNGIHVLKFFLHVSRAEQRRRFLDRIERPEKNWKFSTSDVRDRRDWGRYMKAYEAAVRGTASRKAPWFVVPADHKWFTRLVVAAAIVRALEAMDPRYPEVDDAQKSELEAARRLLVRQR